jgi:uncharacterized protein YdhG (YjbR/CyaY superfamily)
MAATKPPTKTAAAKPATKTAAAKGSTAKFTDEERAAVKEYANELKTTTRRAGKATKDDGEADVQAALAKMPADDRALGEAVHALVAKNAPELAPRTWYGMPAYSKDDKVVFWFKNASKFKQRYATLGFSDKATLDDGEMWPTEYAITQWTPAVEKKVTALVKAALR